MAEQVLKIQERHRNGINFYSILARSGEAHKKYGWALRQIKKHQDARLLESDPYIQAVIRFVAAFACCGEYEVITVPPASAEGVCWAGDIAKRVEALVGIPFVQFFEPHNQGKRFHLAAKFKPIEYRWAIKCVWGRVLVFDDFSLTNFTITNTIREIRNQAECDGIVIYT